EAVHPPCQPPAGEADEEARGELPRRRYRRYRRGRGSTALLDVERGQGEDDLAVVGREEVGAAAQGLVVEPLEEQEDGDERLRIALGEVARRLPLDLGQVLRRDRR